MDTVEDDWYQVLKVRPDATQAEITAAHRTQSLISHPDKKPDRKVEANAETARINQAYTVLKDPALRKEYDRKRASTKVPTQKPSSQTTTTTTVTGPYVSGQGRASGTGKPDSTAKAETGQRVPARSVSQPTESPNSTRPGIQALEPLKRSTPRRNEATAVIRTVQQRTIPPQSSSGTPFGRMQGPVLDWLNATGDGNFTFPRDRVAPSSSIAKPPIPLVDVLGQNREVNAFAKAYGRYFPRHDKMHLYMYLVDAEIPIKHKLSTEDCGILRLLMLAHHHSLHVYELPFQEEQDDRFVFSWRKFGRAIEVLLDPRALPPAEQKLPGRS